MRVLYSDGGYLPSVVDKGLRVGPEQLVVVATGGYADARFDIRGRDETIRVPVTSERVGAEFNCRGQKQDCREMGVPVGGCGKRKAAG